MARIIYFGYSKFLYVLLIACTIFLLGFWIRGLIQPSDYTTLRANATLEDAEVIFTNSSNVFPPLIANPILNSDESQVSSNLLLSLSKHPHWKSNHRFQTYISALDSEQFPIVLTKLNNLVRTKIGKDMRQEVYRLWGIRDGRAALAHARGIDNLLDRELATLAVIQGWSEHDPSEAINWIDTVNDAKLRNRLLAQILPNLAVHSPEEAVKYANQLPVSKLKNTVMDGIIRSVAASDTAMAMHIVDNSGGKTLPMLAVAAVEEFGLTDLQSTLNWIESFPETNAKDYALATIVKRWAADDPAAAGKYLKELPVGRSTSHALRSLGYTWAEIDIDNSLAWGLDNLKEGSVFGPFETGFIEALAKNSPQDAADYYNSTISEDKERLIALRSIVEPWVDKDPWSASEWILQLPEDHAKEAALRQLVQVWTNYDALQPREWIDNLSDFEHKDLLVDTYLRALASINEDLAVNYYYNRIVDDQ